MIEEMLMKELMKTAAHTRRPFRPHGEGRRCGKNSGFGCSSGNADNSCPVECSGGQNTCRHSGTQLRTHMGPHFNILGLLSTENGISQQTIADRLEIRPQSVSEALARLEEHGFIRREESTEDKRVSLIYLSEKGAEQRKAFCEARAAHAAKFFSPLTDDEKETLYALLKKLNAAKDEIDAKDAE